MTWRRAGRPDLPLALLWTASAVVAVVCAPLLPTVARALPPCALHALTGVPCVACGSTRAAMALTHGRVLEALALNPLAALTMMGGVVGGFVAPGWVALHGPLPGFDRAWSRGSRIAAWCAVAAQWAYLILVRR
ncbi:MAG: DUF2752 domain-containing protein [Candidatus Eisenbacteria bacterium]|uniref:DUF2752 domain-containing protein n=1 Tax=Eiseniibacteriota bacterium TaxID=2212470 RepID=A0A538UA60_UNCEI|nr:MAG: DUF2752 domain-containing protein [Candidatus Eisenbacteria bacterium]